MTCIKQTDTESILIFTKTKYRAKRIGQQLQKAGYTAASLQGNLSQNKRQEALDGFRDGTYQILVATDIAARGIDVLSISHVINYDMPDTTDAYTHRIGRTGRALKTGDAFTFISKEDEQQVRSIERVLGKKIERRVLEGFDYKQPPPERNTEFARPPRPSQQQYLRQKRDRTEFIPGKRRQCRTASQMPGRKRTFRSRPELSLVLPHQKRQNEKKAGSSDK